MEAACRGARERGGLTIGILPGGHASEANPYVDVPVATGLGEARNVIVARTSACLVAVGGEYGTLSEIALALKAGIPVVSLDSWQLTLPETGEAAPIHRAGSPREAVEKALELAQAARPRALTPSRERPEGDR